MAEIGTKRGPFIGDSPSRKRLKKTPTVEIVVEEVVGEASKENKRLVRKSSSVLAGLGGDVTQSLGEEEKKQLTRKMSTILEPTSSFQIIELSEIHHETDHLHPQDNNKCLANLPTEIWIEIFLYLPDIQRWKLATTSMRFLTIFKNWVGFDFTPVFYTNELQAFIGAETKNIITESTISTSFRVLPMVLLPNTNKQEDMLLLAGRKRVSWNAMRDLKKDGHYIEVYANNTNLSKMGSFTKGQNRISTIPLNSDSANDFFPRELLNNSFSDWFGSTGSPEAEPLLHVRFTISPETNICEMLFHMDSQGIRHKVVEGIPLTKHEENAILLSLKEDSRNGFQGLNWLRPYKGIHYPSLPAPQPSGFKDLKLFSYQLRLLAWMKNIESNANKKQYRFSTLYKAPGNLNFYVNVQPPKEIVEKLEKLLQFVYQGSVMKIHPGHFHTIPYNVHVADNGQCTDSFTSIGGIVADEMGLGKTISMIALLLAHPRSKESLTHKGTAPFESKGSLVVCPTQLVNQWKKEIESRTSLSVLAISTIVNVKKLTYQSLCTYDVVIASHNLLTKTKAYIDSYLISPPSDLSLQSQHVRLHYVGWQRIILDEGHEILSDGDGSGLPFACGKNIWNRFSSRYRWYVTGTPLPRGRASFIGAINFLGLSIQSGYPADEYSMEYSPYELLLARAVHKCLFWRNTKENVKDQTNIPPLTETIEYLSFTPVEKALYDACAIIEDEEEQRRICSHPFLSSLLEGCQATSLQEIPAILIEKYKQEIHQSSVQIPQAKNEVIKQEEILRAAKELFATLEVNPPAWVIEEPNPLPGYIGACRTDAEKEEFRRYKYFHSKKNAVKNARVHLRSKEMNVAAIQSRLVRAICQSACFSRLYPSGDHDPCDLCDATSIHCPTKTKCGHIFCSVCISKHVATHGNCATCHAPLHLDSLNFDAILSDHPTSSSPIRNMISYTPKRCDEWVSKITDSHGSKLAHISYFLRTLMEEKVKVIVFSQYAHILNTLTDILEPLKKKKKKSKKQAKEDAQAGILRQKIVSCKGNIHVRKKVLASFNSLDDDSPRVLMLSLSHAASGTHLAIATHIILVDPVVGTKEEAQATDAQAIARAHRLGQAKPVVAVRFIIEDTIDQQDYEQTYGSD